jgi:hypothetical protein
MAPPDTAPPKPELYHESLLFSSLPHVIECYHTARIGRHGCHGEFRVHVFRQQTLSTPERQRVQEQVQFIYQIVGKQRVDELAGAVRRDVPARVRPSAPVTDSITLSRMMVVFRHIGFWSVRDTTYFFGAFCMSPNGSPGATGSKASACIAYVRRPRRNASTSRINAPKLLPMSSCQ